MHNKQEDKMRTQTAIIIALVLLLFGSVGWHFYQSQESKTRELELLLKNGQLATIIAEKRQAIDSANTRISIVEERIDNVGEAFKDVTDSLTGLIRGKDRTIATLKVALRPQIDSNPDLSALLQNQDSATLFRDSLISALQAHNLAQFNDFTELGRLQRFQIEQQVAISHSFEQQAIEFQRRYEKAEKKLKKRWSVGPSVSYGISKEGLSPNVGVSIQYSLLMF
jgi:hypothetical protein